MYANNETGQLLPIKEIGDLLTNHQAAFHVDAVQVAGKLPIHPEELGVDFLSISAHKFHGPKGVGLLYHNDLHFDNLLHGGEQEEKRRASTENLVGIAGMTAAYKQASKNYQDNYKHVETIRQVFLNSLTVPYEINSVGPSLPHVINISFSGKENGPLLTLLDLAGFAVSTGSACTAGTVDPSHVIQSLYGKDSDKLKTAIRVSLSEENTAEELQSLAEKLNQNHRRLTWHLKKAIHLTDCKYRYTISPNVKKFTLRDTTFVQNKIGNYELHRLLEKVPNSGEGFPLKITINKDLTGFKLSITDKSGLRNVNIFKNEDHHILQEKFYFLMQSLVDRNVFEQEEV